MGSQLQIVRKEQAAPENYAHFFLHGGRFKNEVRVVLRNGHAQECSYHRKAFTDQPCECMKLANTAPDKDQYWKPIKEEDFSDLIDE